MLSNSLKKLIPEKETLFVLTLVKSLCAPYPRKRGHRKNLKPPINQYNLERIISELDILAKKTEYKIYLTA